MKTININNLSKEQLEDLEKQIAEAKKVLTNYGRKRVGNNELYYYIDYDYSLQASIEDNEKLDLNRFNM